MQPRTYFLLAAGLCCAGLIYRAPVLKTGFIIDDYAQLSMMEGTYPVPRAPLALFTFSNGSAAENRSLRDAGFFPWWSSPQLRVSLFRPLSSALMWADRSLFAADPWKYHLHSASWWLAMMLGWLLLLRRLLPPAAALLALGLCVVHPAHTVLLGWIANRNAIVASCFCLLGLWAQLRAREDNWRPGTALAAISYMLALGAGEYALGFIAFGLMYELLESGNKRRVVVAVIALFAYGMLRSALGFGARGSGMYIDPVAEPAAFLREAILRLPVLVSDLVFALRSNWWSGGYPWAAQLAAVVGLPPVWAQDFRLLRTWHELAGVPAIAAAVWVAWSAQRSQPRLRFVALGLPLSLLPALGSLPESRLLLPSVLGWSILLAQLAADGVKRLRVTRNVDVYAQLGAATALAVLEALSCLHYTTEETDVMPRLAHAVRQSILAPELDPVLRGARRAMLVAAVDPTTTIYIPLVRRWHGRPGPERCQLLLSAYSSMRLARLSARSFRLERLERYYTPPDLYARVFDREPPRAGQRFDTAGFSAIVERVVDGMPVQVRYELDIVLDDPAAVLLTQTVSGLRPLAFPPIGQSVVVPAAAPPLALLPNAL
jgi:hypothetical protein